METGQLRPNVIVRGLPFPEPIEVIVTVPMGSSVKLLGKGMDYGQVYEPVLSSQQVATLGASPEREPFNGEGMEDPFLNAAPQEVLSPRSKTR